MPQDNIRNFVIIAHIDHGKSTLADRLLEITGTVEPRRMRAQYLDQLDLERERGITIKMAPVRMVYHAQFPIPASPAGRSNSQFSNEIKIKNSKIENSNSEYILNLIDTPGHSDFSYEVSRALAAVEGAILLVDATKGIQAQTLSNFRAAKRMGLTIVGAMNKMDLNPPQAEKNREALAQLLKCDPKDIFNISGKTGAGVEDLLHAVIERVPSPSEKALRAGGAGVAARALIFDSLYNDHKGILAYVRVMEGEFMSGDELVLLASETKYKTKELGYFVPELKAASVLRAGEMGYIATGSKEPALVKIGDTMVKAMDSHTRIGELKSAALPGYRDPAPVVFISFYPDGGTKFEDLEKAFARLHLTDAALNIEPDANDALGRGLKVGFLGQLHFDITATRLEREFGLEYLTTFPSIAYRVRENGVERIVKEAHSFPVHPDEVWEPVMRIEILTPNTYLQKVLQLAQVFDLDVGEIETLGDNLLLIGRLPLAELIRDFDDQLKSVSAGFASFSYELAGEQKTEAEKLEILIAGEVVPALTRVVKKKDLEREARATVERLKDLLPMEQFAQAIQAQSQGRIIARETIVAMKKDVTGYLYGGDRSRKMKLWKKQQRGKARLKEMAKVTISPETFRAILKK